MLRLEKIYWVAIAICLLGFFIVFQAKYNEDNGKENSNIGFCVIKRVTHIPCPACGTTRAVLLLTKGNFLASFLQNPLGLVISFFLLVMPFLILYDLVYNKRALKKVYNQFEVVLKRKQIIILLIISVALNWIWNIVKNV